MGDEDAADFTGADAGAQDLMLRGFAAVKQPDFAVFGQQVERGAGDVALDGGRA
jgi:hypothetical protein